MALKIQSDMFEHTGCLSENDLVIDCRAEILVSFNASVSLLMLQMFMDGGHNLPLGEPYAWYSPLYYKKIVNGATRYKSEVSYYT